MIVGDVGNQQGLAQTGMRQDKIVVGLEQYHLIQHARFAPAQLQRSGTALHWRAEEHGSPQRGL